MRLLGGQLALTFCVSGCSILYNPANLPPPTDDGRLPPDAEVILDADPTALALERVSPTVLFEGDGTGGGRAAVLTIFGSQMVQGAQVMITAHAGTGTPMITVDNANAQVASNGRMIAVPVVLAVDPALDAPDKIRLDVTVIQPTPAGDVTRTLSDLGGDPAKPVLELLGLNELNAGSISLASGVHEFSSVDLTGTLTAADTNGPLIVRAHGAVAIDIANVSGLAQAAGPGGGAGGNGGSKGVIPTKGAKGLGPGGGLSNGGGGGFGSAGGGAGGGPVAGDAQVTSYASNAGGGGAGGDATTLNDGGAGGGGGGTIEITSGGTLAIGTRIDAIGGNGAGANGGAVGGGGGSGGLVVLRSGVSIAAPAINVGGGTGENPGGNGRIRLDAPAAPTTNPVAYRGPMFAADTPVLTRVEQPQITVFGEKNKTFQYFFLDENASSVRGPFTQTISPAGTNMFQIAEPLFRGVNTLCVQVEGAQLSDERAEARNCITLAYVFTQP
ncbi:MAG TPA: hypothetical protein VFQ53_21820 [Kofleriaceae bacterium]|nr:hypothetical protein [Kofleriaceae bacterium]